MRILFSVFIILALVIFSPVIGLLIALALVGALVLLPVVLALKVVQLILKPVVLIIEMMLVKTERIFTRIYDAVFHRHGAIAH